MHSAPCVWNNKQPTKGLRRAHSNPSELAASRGETVLFSCSKPLSPRHSDHGQQMVCLASEVGVLRGPHPGPASQGQRWAVGSPLSTAIQTRALAPRQPCACPSHWASLCPGGKCLLANSPSRFRKGVGQWRREKGALCPLHLSPLLLAMVCSSSRLGVTLQILVGHRQPNTEVLLLTQMLFKQ